MEERGVRPFPGASPGARNRAGEVAEVVGSIPSSRVSWNGVNSKTSSDYKLGRSWCKSGFQLLQL